MSVRRKSVQGSLLLTGGEGLAFACSFFRNMILARVLTKADFGIAATFSMVMALLEFSAKMGVARFLVRDRDGNEPDFVATGHLVQFSVGLASACVVAGAGWPLAHLFGISQQAGALMLLAFLPLLRGCEHLDVRRFERELRFGPSAVVEAVPQCLITIAAWPVAKWLGDYRAVLVLLVAKAVFSVIASHALAERPYVWRCRRDYIMNMLRFGWPLVLNGFFMFGVLHGEQFLVATFYTMAEFGPYAAAAALVIAPAYLFGRVFSPVILPLLAKVQDVPPTFERRYRQVVCGMAGFSAFASVGLLLGAEALMRLVYGQKYTGSGIILAALAAASSLRNVRIATSLAALAKGDSQNEMWSNGARLIGLLPALWLALSQQPVWMVAATGLAGELCASSVAISRLKARDGIPLAASILPMLWVLGWAAVSISGGWVGVYAWHPVWSILAAAVASLLAAGCSVLAFPDLRREALTLWQQLRQGGIRGLFVLVRGPAGGAKLAANG